MAAVFAGIVAWRWPAAPVAPQTQPLVRESASGRIATSSSIASAPEQPPAKIAEVVAEAQEAPASWPQPAVIAGEATRVHDENCSADCSHSRAFRLLEEGREAYAQRLFAALVAKRRLSDADADRLLRACRLVAEFALQDWSDDAFLPVYPPEETLRTLQREILEPELAALPPASR